MFSLGLVCRCFFVAGLAIVGCGMAVVLLGLLEGVGRYMASIMICLSFLVSNLNPDHLPIPVGSVILAFIRPVHGPCTVHAVPPGW